MTPAQKMSNLTVTSRKDTVRSWRDCQNAHEFCKHFGLRDHVAGSLDCLPFGPDQSAAGCDFGSFISKAMELYFGRVREILDKGRCDDFDWNYLQVANGVTTEDELISLYISFLKATALAVPVEGYAAQYMQILASKIPTKSVKTREEDKNDYILLQRAFHRPEGGQRNVAKPVYDQIVKYYREYDDSVYGSPYTSIVGPSGIGKSFVIQSIARQGLAYVIYVSLAEPSSKAYPRRSLLAQSMTSSHPSYTETERAAMTTFFECYIAASMVQVRLCRKHRIHPLEFFNMQVCDIYQAYQIEIKDSLEKLMMPVRDTYRASTKNSQSQSGRTQSQPR